MNNLLEEKILHGIEREDFRTWHDEEDGDFLSYIRGDDGCKTREEILEDIKRLFGISPSDDNPIVIDRSDFHKFLIDLMDDGYGIPVAGAIWLGKFFGANSDEVLKKICLAMDGGDNRLYLKEDAAEEIRKEIGYE